MTPFTRRIALPVRFLEKEDHMKRKSVIGFFVFILFMSIGFYFSAQAGRPPSSFEPAPEIVSAFNALQEYIAGVPADTLNKGLRRNLVKKIKNALAAYSRGHPCTSAKIIKAFLKKTQSLRRGKKTTSIADDLYNRGRSLLSDLLATLPGDMTCPGLKHFGTELSLDVRESDNKHLAVSTKFGPPRMVSVEVDGEMYTKVLVSGAAHGGEPGLPAVPMVHRLVAFPRGSRITIHASPPTVAESVLLNLYPAQVPSPNDEPDSDAFPDPFYEPPFVRNDAVYASRAAFPSDVCTVTPLGQFRDVPIALVSCAAGRYYPRSNRYLVYRSVDWTLIFSDGSDAFLTEASENPFESDAMDYTDLLLNKEEVPDYVEDSNIEPACDGEELLIVTHTSFREVADELAKWKNSKGILTSVVEVYDATTAEQIDDYIEERYETCKVRLSYVLLLGDAEFVPTFYVSTVFSSQSASDFRYAFYPSSPFDFLPDFGVGRIPVDTLEQANAVVKKIINYESSPPNSDAFYKNVSLAAMFQCCRLNVPQISVSQDPHPTDGWDSKAYVETSELVRNELLGLGYSVERIYTKETCDKYWWNNLHSSDNPRFYHDGTSLPTDIDEYSGFPWDGDENDVLAAFNSGRFLIMQRDHGSENGWFRPKFSKTSISKLTNNKLLPVVFSINCSSGLFDNETNPGEKPDKERLKDPYPTPFPPYGDSSVLSNVYFSEELLRKKDGGAVGIIAATRDTPDTGDDALARGLFDAVWPDTDPKIGSGLISRSRLGDILNYGKLYVLLQSGIQQSLGQPVYLLDVLAIFSLFHVMGDPTLEMWTSKPYILSTEYDLEVLANSLSVKYSIDGAQITALQEKDNGMVPIGRATVKDGEATLQYVIPPQADTPVMLSASMENAVSVLLTAQPSDLPDESAFSENATCITFDEEERFVNEHISDQYEGDGVRFVDDAETTPLIIDTSIRQGETHSPPYSLSNDADTLNPGSAGVPLTINFTTPIQRVGMYIGNGWGSTADIVTQAVLTAYNAQGDAIFFVTRDGFGNDVTTFIGLDVGGKKISRVKLDYGDVSNSEEIDDLIFE